MISVIGHNDPQTHVLPYAELKVPWHCHKAFGILLWNGDLAPVTEHQAVLSSLCSDEVDRRVPYQLRDDEIYWRGVNLPRWGKTVLV